MYSPPGTAKQDQITPRSSTDISEEDEGQEVSWWGGDNGRTPTTANFMQFSADQAPVASSDGFISLMDNNPKPAQAGANGNSGSWLSRWWKRDSTPGPVRANLGEEKTFYYDPELKRWVNKAAGEPEAPKPAAPPPPPSRTPSRAQTASPGMSGPRPPSTGPPPPRSASAANLSAPPPPKPNPAMRISSHLVPTPEIPEGPGSAPSTPTGTRLAPPGPPPGRPSVTSIEKEYQESIRRCLAAGRCIVIKDILHFLIS
ncbi:hypothetical protein VNI00_003324 [Paramarasmius palmivorus]|uniref:Uncharacterized protein n=1 Tax=Paramarasmius palmivorus TaxID=297713 RepID=A0AAW0DUR3_9AGAR